MRSALLLCRRPCQEFQVPAYIPLRFCEARFLGCISEAANPHFFVNYVPVEKGIQNIARQKSSKFVTHPCNKLETLPGPSQPSTKKNF